jgi:peptidyl-prolyl cis-trans isomerase C
MEIRAPEHPGQALLADYEKKNTISDADIKAEYDKFKAQAERHRIPCPPHPGREGDDAKALIAQIKGGAKFEDLRQRTSKDPGSGANGGDLDFAAPSAYVPEFLAGDGEAEEGRDDRDPVKSQFGYHIIKLEDHPRRPSSRRSRKSRARSSSASRSRRSPRSATRSGRRRRPDYKFSNQ